MSDMAYESSVMCVETASRRRSLEGAGHYDTEPMIEYNALLTLLLPE